MTETGGSGWGPTPTCPTVSFTSSCCDQIDHRQDLRKGWLWVTVSGDIVHCDREGTWLLPLEWKEKEAATSDMLVYQEAENRPKQAYSLYPSEVPPFKTSLQDGQRDRNTWALGTLYIQTQLFLPCSDNIYDLESQLSVTGHTFSLNTQGAEASGSV